MNVYGVEFCRLSVERVSELLENFKPETVPFNEKILAPRSGDIIIFWTQDAKKSRDWVYDGLAWKNQGGKKPLPPAPNEPKLYKTYYHLLQEDRSSNKTIIKDVYFPIDRELPVVIHYIDKNMEGNEILEYNPPPHGNTKNKENAEGFVRTLPSIYSQLKQNASQKSAHLMYKESSKKQGPRDLKQCRNLRYAVNRQKRFTYDEIANLAKLTKSKNMGSTGRKTRGHAINSIVPMSTDTLASTGTNSNISKVLIMDLISENNHHLIEQILSKKILIKLSMLTNDHRNLCDAFLTCNDLSFLSGYFNKGSWKNVSQLIDLKLKHCTCKICSTICLEKSIECDECYFWYHFDCLKLSAYYRTGKAKSWSCEKMGLNCEKY